jgi:hypothetical protein
MTDIEALWEAVRKFPNEDAPLQMLVDELLERGDERAASVLRWGASVPWTVQPIKRPKFSGRAVAMSKDWLSVPEVWFDWATEAVARTVLTPSQWYASRLVLNDRLLVRTNQYSFLAVLGPTTELLDTRQYVVLAKSVGEVKAEPVPGETC